METRIKRLPLLLPLLLLAGCSEDTVLPSGTFASNEITFTIYSIEDENGEVLTSVVLRNIATNTAYLTLSHGDTIFPRWKRHPISCSISTTTFSVTARW